MSDQDGYKYQAYTIEITSTADADPLRLKIRSPEQKTRSMGNPAPGFTKRNLENELDDLRKKLSMWATNYDSYLEDKERDQLRCDPDKIKDMWINLAAWGRGIYRLLFNIRGGNASRDPQMELWRQRIKKKKGARLVIDSSIGNIPWGLIYDEKIPKNLGDDYLKTLLNHFWMTSYELDVLPDYPESSADWETTLDNKEATRFTVAINQDLSGGYGLRQLEFFHNMPKDPPSLRIGLKKNEVLKNISKRKEALHLLYFFCHHQKGATWSVDDYRDVNDSKILIRGNYDGEKEDGTISLRELVDDEDIVEFAPPNPPVIFLNCCTSAQVEIGDPTSFMYYFIYILASQAFIGTESKIPGAFADPFGQRFVNEFLEGRRIGDILFDARLDFARNYHNPFGLYYTLFGNGNIRLSQSIKGTA
jgi:hypothetical protein